VRVPSTSSTAFPSNQIFQQFEKLYYEKRNLASTAVFPLGVGALNAIQGNGDSDVWSQGISSAHV